MSLFDMKGKVAVITGAGSGVGRAAVKLFVENGAKVIAADINLPAVKETLALETKSEDDLAAARRGVDQATRTAFYGVRSGTAQVWRHPD